MIYFPRRKCRGEFFITTVSCYAYLFYQVRESPKKILLLISFYSFLYIRKYYFFVFVAPFLVFQAHLLFLRKRNRFLLAQAHYQLLPHKLLFLNIILVGFQYNNLFLSIYIDIAVDPDTDCISV